MSKAVKAAVSTAKGALSGDFSGFGKQIGGPLGSFTDAAGVGRVYNPREAAFTIGNEASRSKDVGRMLATSRQRSESLQAQADQSAEARRGLRQQLEAQASGQAPSLAEAQLKAATDRTLAQQLAAAQSVGRGSSQSALARNLARQQQAAGAELAQQSAQARLVEQQQAQEQLGQLTAQDQQVLNSLAMQYEQQGFSIMEAQQQAQEDLEAIRAGQYQAAQQARTQFQGGLLSAGGGALAAMASDKNEKTDIKKASTKDVAKMLKSLKKEESSKSTKSDPKKFLESLKAYTYKYKDDTKEGTRKGDMLSVMAQDLEKDQSTGKSMVSKSKEGHKMVDYAKGYGAILAAQAHLNERLSELEKIKKSRKK